MVVMAIMVIVVEMIIGYNIDKTTILDGWLKPLMLGKPSRAMP